MIEVRPHGEYRHGFIIQGHAEFAEHGRDIVCASVSAISQMIANELRAEQVATISESSDGYLSVMNYKEGYPVRLINMMIRNLKLIEEQYPQNIKIFEEETLWEKYVGLKS